MITIIHPSRGRAKQAFETGLKWIKKIGLPEDQFEYVLSLDSDDNQLWLYPSKMPCLNSTRFIGENRSAIDAINFPAKFYSAYRKEDGCFLIVISDDFDCPDDWGVLLTQQIRSQRNYTDWILKTRDGIQDWIITLPIMDWKYYRRFNYIYYPEYKHAWCDTELTCVAEIIGRLEYSTLLFKHNHHSITGLKDSTSERVDYFFEQGRNIFQERINKNFDLPKHWRINKMSHNYYTRMKQ